MDIFQELGLESVNAGACSGPGRWVSTTSAGLLDSVNPATGQVLAQVHCCSEIDYDAHRSRIPTSLSGVEKGACSSTWPGGS